MAQGLGRGEGGAMVRGSGDASAQGGSADVVYALPLICSRVAPLLFSFSVSAGDDCATAVHELFMPSRGDSTGTSRYRSTCWKTSLPILVCMH